MPTLTFTKDQRKDWVYEVDTEFKSPRHYYMPSWGERLMGDVREDPMNFCWIARKADETGKFFNLGRYSSLERAQIAIELASR